MFVRHGSMSGQQSGPRGAGRELQAEKIRDAIYSTLGTPFFAYLLYLDARDGDLSAGSAVIALILGGLITRTAAAVVQGIARVTEQAKDDEQWRD